MDLSTTGFDPALASREANHRFRNTLTALQGSLRTDFRSFADPAIRQAIAIFESRIQAFARVHRALEDEPGDPFVDVPAHLTRLCADLCAAHLAHRGVRCELRSDSGFLTGDVCQKLSLIIVELVTNAAKHAFTGRGGGCVRISFQRCGSGWICAVADNGRGLHGDYTGLGSALVKAPARDLGAELRFRSAPGSTVVSISLAQARFGRTLDDRAPFGEPCPYRGA